MVSTLVSASPSVACGCLLPSSCFHSAPHHQPVYPQGSQKECLPRQIRSHHCPAQKSQGSTIKFKSLQNLTLLSSFPAILSMPGHLLLLSLAQTQTLVLSPFTWLTPPQPLDLRLYINLYVSFRLQLRCHLFPGSLPEFLSSPHPSLGQMPLLWALIPLYHCPPLPCGSLYHIIHPGL